MKLSTVLTPELTFSHAITIESKKLLLEKISTVVSDLDSRLKQQTLFEAMQNRERLGSTAIGHGVAIPHARVPGLTKTICLLLTLENPIDFDSEEMGEVDIIFALLVPEDATQEHLDLLANISEKLQSRNFRQALRDASSNEELYEIAIGKHKIES